MADTLTRRARSGLMSRVKNRNTKPEVRFRSLLHRAGYRFRLHASDLPGTPDLVLPRFRTAIFVHGCFWHGHDCPRGKRPSSNTEFWNSKLDKNIRRDQQARLALRREGWTVRTVWECELRDEDLLVARIVECLESRG